VRIKIDSGRRFRISCKVASDMNINLSIILL
jgi:hypothetical protein